MMNLVVQDERLSRAVIEINEDIVRLVAQFAGNPRPYKRERARSIRNFVSEIYSAPRVTRGLKMLPNVVVPGFALDCQAMMRKESFGT